MAGFRAIVVAQQGDTVAAAIERRQRPVLNENEVLVEVHYSSLNYKDALAVSGPSAVVRKLPLIAGIDAAGVVIESNSDAFSKGDQVIATGYELSQSHDGGYAELLCLPADWLVPLPPGLSLSESMILGTAGFTAAIAVHRLLQNGQQPDAGPIIVTGATGGVGSFAINILSSLGFQVTALTGKPDQSQSYLKALGASDLIDRNTLVMGNKPLERGVWAGAIDNLGGATLAWLTRSVQPYGNIAACGLAGGPELQTTVMPFILRGVSVLGIASSFCTMSLRKSLWQNLATVWKPSKLNQIHNNTITLDKVVSTAASMLAAKTWGRCLIAIK